MQNILLGIILAIVLFAGIPVVVGSVVRFFAFGVMMKKPANGTIFASLFAAFVLAIIALAIGIPSPNGNELSSALRGLTSITAIVASVVFWRVSLRGTHKLWLLVEGSVLCAMLLVLGYWTIETMNEENASLKQNANLGQLETVARVGNAKREPDLTDQHFITGTCDAVQG